MKKIFIMFLILILSISQTNAWIGLIAENGDLLNISKWNELVADKLSISNLKAGDNITLTNSGSDIYINGTVAGNSAPFITNELEIKLGQNETKTITLNGENFIPTTTVSTNAGTVSNLEVISPSELTFDLNTISTVGNYDMVLSNDGITNSYWLNNGVGLIKVVPVSISGDDISGRKWTNGDFAETCNQYLNTSNPYEYSGDIGDGIYWIKPDSSQSEFKVYCDMTTSNGGWTRFVNIKGNYSFNDAKQCWLGTNISNSNLECFNPNRYGISVNTLMNIDWSGTYNYSMINSNSSLTTQSSRGKRKCIGHDEYMTIMKGYSYPNKDGSDTEYIRLGANYCKSSREVAGISSSNFMNYDNDGSFGKQSNARRESNYRNTKIYFK